MTTITIDRALLEQALDALNCCYSEKYDGAKFHGAKAALRAALTAQPQTLDEAMAVPRAMAQAYENGYNAALANGPAWHDAPTEPGLWVCHQAITDRITAYEVTDEMAFNRNLGLKGRWFGPIPPDGDTK